MEPRDLKFIATACGGALLNGSPQTTIQKVCTDSRQLQPGDLFFALSGPRFDAHAFLSEVSRKAAGVVVRRDRVPAEQGNAAVIAVDDPQVALGKLAAAYRKTLRIPMIAVGGSNGKTTTKELIASVLRQKLNAVWSEASFNNSVGVPLTLLRIQPEHQAAVLEVGTNHPGELGPLVRMIQPQYGVITCIGREHLEFFGDLAGVAREEGALAEALPSSGKLFLNGDNEWSDDIARRTSAQVVRVGLDGQNDWRATNLRTDKHGISFRVHGPAAAFCGEFRLNLWGRHQAVNALFAVSLAAELGLSRAEVEHGLAECKPAKMRLQIWEWNGVRVLDDAYNANADSMVAALQTLQELPCKGRRVAVLGDMGELGAHSEAAHEEVGRRAAELGVGQLFAVGKMAPVMARGARNAGLNRVFEFSDVETAAAAVKQFMRNGDLILLKASRAARLEQIGELLRAGGAARKN
ncbi:MAG TPA: UDP-N-acetylmuramoyl-tripeptide--D-alanyl-D-alanine ligase [Verrucomicrobiae bacterium]|nr:UDP-N-acetylmuramoyl-tripeptide--D-alanyl-D-alanine ligase [Verrucomicrobiae bacterium]